VKYNVSVTFCSVPFFVHTPGAKTHERICTIDGSKHVKSAKDVLLGRFIKKFSPPLPLAPKSKNFALGKFFPQNTYRSWWKHRQNLYLNRKQPMGISNLGLKIWPEVVLWPFLSMRIAQQKICFKIPEIVVKFPNFLVV